LKIIPENGLTCELAAPYNFKRRNMNPIAIPKNTRFRRYALVASAVLVALPCVLSAPSAATRGTSQSPAQTPPQAAPQPSLAAPQAQATLAAHSRRTQHHWYQVGRASWYGGFFQGRETASGEDFDMNAMTCAHPSLPMGSLVRVTNLRNHKSVVVRVNDRGPIQENRIVDLSYAAARMLGFSRRGTAPVRLELVAAGPQLARMAFPASTR
jgi:rare lipoprotein A